MNIQTTRFGLLTITKEDMVTFPEGLLGFENYQKFIVVDDPRDEIFVWLQSCEEGNMAFPILEPDFFTINYQARLGKRDERILELNEGQTPQTFTIVTIPSDPTLITANLKAPILINDEKKLGIQCVLQDNKLSVNEPIFTTLQEYFMNRKKTTKRHSQDLSVHPL